MNTKNAIKCIVTTLAIAVPITGACAFSGVPSGLNFLLGVALGFAGMQLAQVRWPLFD